VDSNCLFQVNETSISASMNVLFLLLSSKEFNSPISWEHFVSLSFHDALEVKRKKKRYFILSGKIEK